jgi:hypothetical protein
MRTWSSSRAGRRGKLASRRASLQAVQCDEDSVDVADFDTAALFERVLDAVVIARLASGRIVL